MKFAIIQDELVVNIIEARNAEVLSNRSDHIEEVPEDGLQPEIGWEFLEGAFVAPVIVEEPESPAEKAARERRERIGALRENGNIPITGQALRDLLKDILDSL